MSNELGMQEKPMAFSAMISTKKYQQAINNSLRDPARARRFVAAITSAVAANRDLKNCDPYTVLSSALLGEGLNLSPSPQLGQYYLVPFENKKEGKTDAQFILGYKGMIQLALRSGQYKHLNVLAVKEGELLSWDPLTEEIDLAISWTNDDKRDSMPTVGYVAFFEYLNGFKKTIYWSKEKMIAHADRYSPAFSKDAQTIKTKKGTYTKVSFADYEDKNYPSGDYWMYSSFWYKDFDGMAYKTMLRQLISKWGIMSVDMQSALDMDGAIGQDDGGYIHFDETATQAIEPPTFAKEEVPASKSITLEDVK